VANKDDVVVTACPGGPLLVRGDVTILDDDGNPLPLHRRTVALCRCGASALRPLCDGTHRSLPPDRRPPA
jgi:CDGSH-type Zn-finger protein